MDCGAGIVKQMGLCACTRARLALPPAADEQVEVTEQAAAAERKLAAAAAERKLAAERAAAEQAAAEQEAADALGRELDVSERERKASLRKVSQDLSDLAARLENAEASTLPWSGISSVKDQVNAMQSAVGEQISEAKQKQEEIEAQQGQLLAKTASGKVRAMHEGVFQSHRERRTSLSEVQESLQSISAKLGVAETSWIPWGDVSDAKKQVMSVQDIVGQQVSDSNQGHIAGQGDADTLKGA